MHILSFPKWKQIASVYLSVSLSVCITIITGRNEVVAKVMFLQVCVYPQGGGCLPQCMLGCHTPPGWRTPFPGPGRPPQMEEPPLRWRTPRNGEPPWDQADTPPGMENPPEKQTPAYGLRAASTHPTGMHSCIVCACFFSNLFWASAYSQEFHCKHMAQFPTWGQPVQFPHSETHDVRILDGAVVVVAVGVDEFSPREIRAASVSAIYLPHQLRKPLNVQRTKKKPNNNYY